MNSATRMTAFGPPGMAPAAPSDNETLGELETRLNSADAATADAARDDAVARLDALEAGLRRSVQAGLPPAEFVRIAALADACVAARETVLAAAARAAARR